MEIDEGTTADPTLDEQIREALANEDFAAFITQSEGDLGESGVFLLLEIGADGTFTLDAADTHEGVWAVSGGKVLLRDISPPILIGTTEVLDFDAHVAVNDGEVTELKAATSTFFPIASGDEFAMSYGSEALPDGTEVALQWLDTNTCLGGVWEADVFDERNRGVCRVLMVSGRAAYWYIHAEFEPRGGEIVDGQLLYALPTPTEVLTIVFTPR
jgi:hypothetical protein